MPNLLRASRLMRAFCFSVIALFACGTMWASGSTTVVINQVYGGGGSTSASSAYNVDYVELLNVSNAPIDISGWSIQYGASTSKSAAIASSAVFTIPVNTAPLASGHYFLIAGTNSAGFGGASISNADFPAGVVSFSASAGKVFLVNSATALTLDANGCPASGSTVDFVGYGGSTPNCYEGFGNGGSAAPTISNVSSVVRTGCIDTDNNGADFTVSTTPTPHTTTSTPAVCPGGAPTVFGATAVFTPPTATVGTSTLLTATVTPASSPVSTGITVTADLTAFGGTATTALHDDGVNGDAHAGDNIFSYSLAVPGNQATQAYTVTLTAKDQTTTVHPTAALTVSAPVIPVASIALSASSSSVVINTPITLTAIASGNTTAAPTGTMKFYDGATLLGNGTASSAGAITTYTYSATFTTLGLHTITATYGGDGTYPANTTTTPASVPVTVIPVPTPDFTVSVANTSLIATSSAKLQQTVVSVGFVAGFNSPVALTCSGLPAGSRCVFSPQTLSAAGNSMLTIGIDGASNRQEPSRNAERTALAFAALALPLLLIRRKKLASVLLAMLVLGAMGMSLTGCSGGTSTTAGSSTVTVTGTSSGTTHTATFTLVVQ